MGSRENILAKVRAAKPEHVPLPDLPSFITEAGDYEAAFCTMIEQIGGEALRVPEKQFQEVIEQRFPAATFILSTTSSVESKGAEVSEETDPHTLADLDLFVCEGKIGVAENGAVWVDDEALLLRAAPFITQHLILLLDRKQLVGNMHEAYRKLGASLPGFGVFIAGPSKTADIEQSLVIGAHGARSLLVMLY